MASSSPNRRHNLTYAEIIQAFKEAATAHLGINTFDTGTLDFLDANAVNKEYPYVYMRPLSSQGVVDKQRGLTFELYSMDVPKLSDESPVDAQSRTEMYIYDLIAWFNKGTTDRQQLYEVEITDLSPVNEAFQDRVYGWVATVNVLTSFKWDYCDYPQLPPPVPAPVSPPPVPVPVPSPVPVPVPAPIPTFYSFLIDSTNVTGSLDDACVLDIEPSTSVYTEYDTQGDPWPINTIGKQIYTDEALTIPYHDNATDDDDYFRLAKAEGEFAALKIEWSNFTASNQVLDAKGCNRPIIVNKSGSSDGFTLTFKGGITDFAGLSLENIGFRYGNSPSSLTNFISGSSLDINNEFSASVTVTDYNKILYYRTEAQDVATSFIYKASGVVNIGSSDELPAGYRWESLFTRTQGVTSGCQATFSESLTRVYIPVSGSQFVPSQCNINYGLLSGSEFMYTLPYTSSFFTMTGSFDSTPYEESLYYNPFQINPQTPVAADFYANVNIEPTGSDNKIKINSVKLCNGAPAEDTTLCTFAVTPGLSGSIELNYGNFTLGTGELNCLDVFEQEGTFTAEITCPDKAFPCNIVNSLAYVDSTFTEPFTFQGTSWAPSNANIIVRYGEEEAIFEIQDIFGNGSAVLEAAWTCQTVTSSLAGCSNNQNYGAGLVTQPLDNDCS